MTGTRAIFAGGAVFSSFLSSLSIFLVHPPPPLSAVISPDVYLNGGEIGVPPYFAARLSFPERVSRGGAGGGCGGCGGVRVWCHPALWRVCPSRSG